MQPLNIGQLNQVAEDLVQSLNEGNRIFLFSGDVGAGKTTLIQIIARLLGVKTPVQSPTFGIVHAYDSLHGKIQHSDWYRLQHLTEIYEIGLHEDLENDIWFIEWPEIGLALLQEYPFIHVHIETPSDPQANHRYYNIVRHEGC